MDTRGTGRGSSALFMFNRNVVITTRANRRSLRLGASFFGILSWVVSVRIEF